MLHDNDQYNNCTNSAILGLRFQCKYLAKTIKNSLVKVANTHELGIDMLTEISMRKAELDVIENEKTMKKRMQQFNIIDEYIKLDHKKGDDTKWTASEFRVAIKALKEESDGAMAVKKKDLVNMYNKMEEKHNYVMEEYKVLKDELDG